MLGFLPAPLLGLLVLTLTYGNTAVGALLLFLLMPFRILLPGQALQNRVTDAMMATAENWVAVNSRIYELLPPIHWEVDYPANLDRNGWYMVTANHQTWVDIPVLFHIFSRRIPFLKYFLKQELLWVPFLGQAVYFLDFPFMKRYSKAFLEKHPELRGKDMETTRRACAKFRHTPVSVINFLEGTRFTKAKHDEQQSPYQRLLKPKAGGLAFVLSALGAQMHSLLDVTIVYPGGVPSFWDFLSGRVRHVVIKIVPREIPASCFTQDYETDPAFRAEFQEWTGKLWQEKDELLQSHSYTGPSA